MSEDERDWDNEVNGTNPFSEEPSAEAPAETETVTLALAEFDALQQKAEERDRLFQQLQRAVADFDNYQKRVKRDRPQWEADTIRRFLADFLPVVDDFDRLRAALATGLPAEDVRRVVSLIAEKMAKVLADWKIESIPGVGAEFDPALHEALRQEATGAAAPGSVVEEIRKGYTMDGVVLRAAQVVVARAPEADRTGSSTQGE
jgi:molecular chaperone GrpE